MKRNYLRVVGNAKCVTREMPSGQDGASGPSEATTLTVQALINIPLIDSSSSYQRAQFL